MSPASSSAVVLRRSTRLTLNEVSLPEIDVSPKKRKRASSWNTAESEPNSESDLTSLEELDVSPTGRKVKRSKDVTSVTQGKMPRKPRQLKPQPVYMIPDVDRKQTTFKGRLGYACLNTILRNKRPVKESVFCSRTCRLDSLQKNGIEWVKDLGRRNVEDLLTLIQWNEDNNIRFMRMSSEMFPFASHGTHGYSLEYCAPLLAQVGVLAKKFGHRLTAHPGQFTQLGSPKPQVIQSSVRELKYHCEMMDRMGLGIDAVLIVHGGGMYDDKVATLARIKKTITEILPKHVRDRLVLENDELCYNAEDLLPLCEELDVPLVFDYHHDSLFPSSIPPSAIIQRANAIWARRGIKPKQHLSEPRPGAVTLMERRAHADRCGSLPPDLPDDMDLMIEAKDKEQAVLHLYRIYELQPVNHDSLRPPTENQTKETKGRKSNKKARAKAAAGEEESEEDLGVEELPKKRKKRKSARKKSAQEEGESEQDTKAMPISDVDAQSREAPVPTEQMMDVDEDGGNKKNGKA